MIPLSVSTAKAAPGVLMSSPGFHCTENKDPGLLEQVEATSMTGELENVRWGAAEAIGFAGFEEEKAKQRCYFSTAT